MIGIGRKEFKPVVALPIGSYEWQNLSGEFMAESSSIELQIRITGTGEFWLDNLKLEAIQKKPVRYLEGGIQSADHVSPLPRTSTTSGRAVSYAVPRFRDKHNNHRRHHPRSCWRNRWRDARDGRRYRKPANA